jgi:hypothetical protein
MWHAWERREKFLMGKPEGKRQLGRPRRRWDQNRSWRLAGVCGFNWLRIRAGVGLL